MNHEKVIADYGPFQTVLEANGVMSKDEQFAIAQMAIAALTAEQPQRVGIVDDLQARIQELLERRFEHDSVQGVDCPVCFSAHEIAEDIAGRLAEQTTEPSRAVVSLELMEALAADEHERWSGQALTALNEMTDARRERWARLAVTPYADLDEKNKELDRMQVRERLAIMAKFTAPQHTAEIEEQIERAMRGMIDRPVEPFDAAQDPEQWVAVMAWEEERAERLLRVLKELQEAKHGQ